MTIAEHRARHKRLMKPLGGRESSELAIIPIHAWRRVRLEKRNVIERRMRAIATISQLNPLKRKIEINFIRPEPIIVENAGLPPVMFVSVGKNAFPWDEPPPEKERVLIADVQHAVCEFYGISRTDLLSQRRHTSIVRPRQISMYLAKKITFRSFPQIGRQHGWRDWSTAIHAVRRIEELMQADGELADEVAEICGRLEA